MNLNNLLTNAIEAAEAACLDILEVYNTADFQEERKGDQSPLTLADKRSHATIAGILASTNLPVLSEEGKTIPYEIRKNWEYFWMVDPLDGTKEFIKRNGEFTVNIALIHNQEPILGVVAIPVTNQVFYAVKNQGAFIKENQLTRKLAYRPSVDLSKPGVRVVASRSHIDLETQAFVNKLNEPQLVSKGSSLKFLLVAEGAADVYPRFAPTMEWDTAAAHAIVNEVGYRVLQKDSDKPVQYNKPDLLNPFFICIA
ncbi:3'(2'),5'-bisphosphate nucleotidase [Chryseotalea sanaruensis]|uniref:3'(2'),5'-bisphosphate nucleotidase CysQ n=1 Tax=Chryseotalea sanaruensis TaxID=2482724 RepID=A0A401U6Z0_9BACT|nr:3'(2'),5'-bisphosphate nucleotidase CysQ [Chryseotalea sanaruensis]GCC50622.1 3'(2'),5'-bisphosphate nucleotidase [Chryseotalea sanaruensis]